MPGKYKSGVRVIGGRWKGTSIAVPPIPGLRPTPDRIRETLFNWLQPHIMGACCLDLFAGSGILSIEALSRGAARALAVDCQRGSVDAMTAVRSRLDAQCLEVRLERTERFLEARTGDTFDIVFIDPPFELGIHRSICMRLQEFGWLTPDALVYIEAPRDENVVTPASWSELKHKQAGNVAYALFHVPGG